MKWLKNTDFSVFGDFLCNKFYNFFRRLKILIYFCMQKAMIIGKKIS